MPEETDKLKEKVAFQSRVIKMMIAGIFAAILIAIAAEIGKRLQEMEETVNVKPSLSMVHVETILGSIDIDDAAEEAIKKEHPEVYADFKEKVKSVEKPISEANKQFTSFKVSRSKFNEDTQEILNFIKSGAEVSASEGTVRQLLRSCDRQAKYLETASAQLTVAGNELINLKGAYEGKVENLAVVFRSYSKVIVILKRTINSKVKHLYAIQAFLARLFEAKTVTEKQAIIKSLEEEMAMLN
jgi:hypothetical protein